MNRNENLTQLQHNQKFDLIVIGGGATGLGIALDATIKGYRVALFERRDFGSGTSSKSTKLLHGGIRYLAQGNIKLVREALKERSIVLHNAAHLAHPLNFIIPCRNLFEAWYYKVGLLCYSLLAGKKGQRNQPLRLPKTDLQNIQVTDKYRAELVQYWDGQFDDCGLLLSLAKTAAKHGCTILNYAEVISFSYDEQEQINGLTVYDAIAHQEYKLQADCVINAAGPWVDQVRALEAIHRHSKVSPITQLSQGTHIVLDKEFWPHDYALLIPKTSDGRVMFVIPWFNKVIVGTTDHLITKIDYNPTSTPQELTFIIDEIAKYLRHKPTLADVKSYWSGIRPLIKSSTDTKSTSREHFIETNPAGLISVCGGKWTTYRSMAQQVMQLVQHQQRLPEAPKAQASTAGLKLERNVFSQDAALYQNLSDDGDSFKKCVQQAIEQEMAISVEDVLARRFRLLFLDARLSVARAGAVASLLRAAGVPEEAIDEQGFVELAQSMTL